MPESLIALWLRLKALVERQRLNRDLDDEIAFHLAMRQEKLKREGLTGDDASAAARRRFGNPTTVRETTRSLWIASWLDALGRDFRFAWRLNAKAPLFAAVAIATLAVGIGANAAIFSVLNGVLLRAMPYDRPQDIYALREGVQIGPQRNAGEPVNGGNFLLWKQQSHSFTDLALLEPTNDNLFVGGESIPVHGLRASASLFPMLGIRPFIGRTFTPQEDEWSSGLSTILTYGLWRDRFHSDPAIVGRKVSLNGYPFIVVGVLPASFYFPKREELYAFPIAGWTSRTEYFVNLKLSAGESRPGIGSQNFAAICRVRPGVTRRQAAADLDVIEAAISKKESNEVRLFADVIPLKAAVVGSSDRSLWIVMAGAGVLLLIVCVNLAGLIMGRNTSRAHEIAIRAALGASRWMLLRQFLTEGLLLSAIGGAAGIFIAHWAIQLLVRGAPITLPRLESVTMDAHVLLFGGALLIVSGVLFSLVPALCLDHRHVEETLKNAALSHSATQRTSRLHDLLAGSEIALSTVLLICAVLLGQSLSHVLNDNAWLNVAHVLTVDLSPPPAHYQKPEDRARFYRDLLHDVRQLPGVASAGLASALPLRGIMWTSDVNVIEIPVPESQRPNANYRFISPDYGRAIGLSLGAGRWIEESDSGRAVALVSENLESLAQRYAGRSLRGLHVMFDAGPQLQKPLEVIGIVKDVRAKADEEPVMAIYVPYWIFPPWEGSLVMRASADPAGVATAVQKLIHKTDPLIAVHTATLREIVEESVATRRFLTSLGLGFALCAMTLAALGLYGVVSLSFARRRREIGIRMALGARRREVFAMVIAKALRLAAAGVLAGVLCGAVLTRLIRSLLYGMRAADPVSFAIACALVIAVALLASFLPARRAAAADPMAALKYE